MGRSLRHLLPTPHEDNQDSPPGFRLVQRGHGVDEDLIRSRVQCGSGGWVWVWVPVGAWTGGGKDAGSIPQEWSHSAK
jgi:hypothetical protein